MKRIEHFDVPTQVKFWDVDGDHYVGGIGVDDRVICGCCGGIFELNEIYEFAPDNVVPVEVMPWIDISHEIIGE